MGEGDKKSPYIHTFPAIHIFFASIRMIYKYF